MPSNSNTCPPQKPLDFTSTTYKEVNLFTFLPNTGTVKNPFKSFRKQKSLPLR